MAKAKRKPAPGSPKLKDPEGGLTAAGRRHFKKAEGAELKPGVRKPLKEMTPEEMKRKGSFLRRHFATLRGPLVGKDGKPTRLALQAHAWGEPVPKTEAAAAKLAEAGSELLDRYQKAKEKGTPAKASAARARPAKSAEGKPTPEAKTRAKPPAKAASKGTAPGTADGKSKGKARSSAKVYTDPKLRERLKAEITAGDKGGKPGQWSARKAQLLAAEYKKAGGEYKDSAGPTEAQDHLNQWTDEKWQTADGEPAIREGETTRYLPKAAWDELSPAEKKATEAKKSAGSKAGKQFVANTPKAKAARKKASSPARKSAKSKGKPPKAS